MCVCAFVCKCTCGVHLRMWGVWVFVCMCSVCAHEHRGRASLHKGYLRALPHASSEAMTPAPPKPGWTPRPLSRCPRPGRSPAHQRHLPGQQQLRLAAQSLHVAHQLQDAAAREALWGGRGTPWGRRAGTWECCGAGRWAWGALQGRKRGPRGGHLCAAGSAVHPVHGLGAGVDSVGELLLHVPVRQRDLADAAGTSVSGQPATANAGPQ